jgi:hypothetical protein
MYARVVAGVLCPRNAAVLLLSLPLASRNRLAGDVLKACVNALKMCQSYSMCSHLYHKPRLLSRYAVASAVFGVLAGLEHLPVPVVQAVLVFAKRSITGGKARFAPALRNTARSQTSPNFP